MSYGNAYFYRPQPQLIDQINGSRHVIGQSFDERAMSMLKDIELVMRYAIPQIEGPSKLVRGDVHITTAEHTAWKNPNYNIGGTWRNGATFTLAQFVDLFHKDEKNFLHGSDGRRLISKQGDRTFYLIRPKYAAKTFWTLLAALHARAYSIGGTPEQFYTWPSNAFIDNVGADDTKIEEVLKEMELSGQAQEYAGGDQAQLYCEEWLEFFDIGRLTMPKGSLLGCNMIGDWFAKRNADELIKRLDLIMLEAFSAWLNMRSSFKSEHSLNILKRAQVIVDAGKHLICVCHLSSKDTPERFAYEYARYLLIAGDKTSCRLVVDGSYSGAPVRIPEMDLDLGKPLSPFRVLTGFKLLRKFGKGDLVVDLESMTWKWTPIIYPEPIDDFAMLKQQVAALQAKQIEHEQTILLQAQALKELQDRLSEPISVSLTGTIKL